MVRNKKIVVAAGILALATLSAEQVMAGAWTQAKGKFYSRLAYEQYSADEYFDENGDTLSYSPADSKKRDFEYDEDLTSLYLEYGLTDKLTLVASLNYKEAEWRYKPGGGVKVDKVANTSGPGDQELGVKYQLYTTEKGVLSIQGMYKTPEGYDEDDKGTLDIQRGDAQEDYDVRLLYGQSLYPMIPGYFNVEAGYRMRSQEPADEFKYVLEVGVDFTSWFYGRVKLDGSANLGNSDDVKSSAAVHADVAGNEVDLGKLDMTLGFKITDHFAVEATYRPELYGESTTKGYSMGLALSCSY
jgi:hypothetical protein